jgi:alkylhydroperoxidase/carboxymuconolactone decarboxylase family protein YurZ
MALGVKDEQLVKLYMAGCLHYWDQLPAIAQGCYAVGATPAELRGCLRHLIV